MAERIVESLQDDDTIFGNFGGNEGQVPVKRLLGHAGLVTIADTAYKLRRGDVGKLLKTTSGSAVTITIPAEAETVFADLAVIAWWQAGAGQITFAGDGFTINSPETLKAAKQHATGVLIHQSADVWVLGGNLEAA